MSRVKVQSAVGQAGPQNTLLAHLLVACALIFASKAGLDFSAEEAVVLQGGLGGTLALLIPCLGQEAD